MAVAVLCSPLLAVLAISLILDYSVLLQAMADMIEHSFFPEATALAIEPTFLARQQLMDEQQRRQEGNTWKGDN